MPPRKHGHAASAKPSTTPTSRAPEHVGDATARYVKRSITVKPEIDVALREIAGSREYSQVANEAFVLYVQARGIDAIVNDIEMSSGPITAEDRAEAERRLADARCRAERRQKARR